MTVRAVEGKQPYTGGTAIEIDENKVISLRLRDENNLIIYDAGDNEIYVDLQLPDELTPTDAFPVGITTGRVIVDNGWDLQGTLICAKTTSGDNIKLLYADEGTLWIDNGTGTFKQIYFKSDVDGIITTLTTYIDGELAKKQNGVTSATAPTDPAEGDLWYDTAHNTLKVYNGSSWVSTGGGGGSGDVVVSTDTGNELSTGVALWFGTETDYSSISTPDTNTLYIQYKSDGGGGWQPGANTLVYWEFNGNLNDSSGNNVTLTGTPYGYDTGIQGQALQSTNNVNLAASLQESQIFSGAFALAFCANMQNTNTLQRLFTTVAGSPIGSVDVQYEFYNDFSGFQVYINPSTRIAFPMTQPNVGEWKSLVLTGDGVNQLELYIDGVKTNPYSNYNTPFSYPSPNYSLYISGRDNTNVLLDGVIIENKHWTQSDVDLYLATYPIS